MGTPAMPRPGGTSELAGREVARVGYGAMQLAERPDGAVTSAQAASVLRRAVELGVNHIDTAEFYGEGTSNQFIRAALHPYGDDLALVSKVGAVRADGALVPAQQPAELRAQVEQNLRTLGAEQLAVVNLRRVDGGTGIRATGDQVVDLDDQLAELAAMRDEGLIGGIGLSGVSVEQLERALPVRIACVQNEYSLVERSNADEFALCREHGIAWVPFFPLGSAFPGRPKVTDEAAVRDTAAAVGATPSQVGLAWLLGLDPRVLLIPGTTSVVHLEENIAAGDVALDRSTMAALGALTP